MSYYYRRTVALLISFTFIISTSACQTLKDRKVEDQREVEVLSTQKNLVIDYINQGYPNMALKELRPLISKYPRDADFKNLLGITYLSLKNPKMAQRYFQESYVLQPRVPVALNLSSAFIDSKQYARALKLLKEVQASKEAKDYQYPERIQHNIALVADLMNKPKLAEKHYVLALQDNPYYYLTLMRLGQLYEKTKRIDQAQAQYQRAREGCLKCFDPVQALVKFAMLQKNTKMALTLLQEYIDNKDVEAGDRSRARRLLSATSRDQPPGQLSLRGNSRPGTTPAQAK